MSELAVRPVQSVASGPEWTEAVNLLYVCDYPPSNFRGGTVLLSRLLKGYPRERLRVLTGAHFYNISPREGLLDCPHIVVPSTDATGRWGLGRLKAALDWCRVPTLALRLVALIRQERVQAILTIADGRFFLAAMAASRMAGIPYILVVHDDWVAAMRRSSSVRYVARPLFAAALHRAAHVYVVSSAMHDAYRERYHLDSEVQLPAIEPPTEHDANVPEMDCSPQFEIVYAGTNTGAVAGALQMMVDVVRSGKLKQRGIDVRFTLYTMLPDHNWKRSHGWDHPSINVQGWLSQAELARAVRRASVLLLPFSFDESEKPWVEHSFPSKTADYIASGRPILVLGPPYSSIVRYARETGCAEVVDTPNLDAIADAIARIAGSASYRDQLRARSLAAFRRNHDVVKQRQEFQAMLQRICPVRQVRTKD